MEKIRIFLGIVLLGGMFACTPECVDCGCDDYGDADNGNFKLVRDWCNLWQDMDQPQELDVYLYHPTLAPWYRRTYTDTSYYALPAGNYQVVTVSKSDAALFQGMDNYYTAEVYLPTYTVDSVLMVTEAPLNLVDQMAINVVSSGTTECIVTPAPFVKVINFRIRITRKGNVKEVIECKGRLNGVLTSAMLCVKQKSWFSACLDFSTQKASESNFTKTVTLLGMNPDINHRLNLILKDIDGTLKSISVDVSRQLNFSKTPILNCTIEIILTGTDTEVHIVDWQPGMEDDIVLQ